MTLRHFQNRDEVKIGMNEISVIEIILKLREWYSYLLSKWISIVLFGLLGGIIGFVYAKYKKPVYTATTTFVLESGENNTGVLGQYAGLASMVGLDIGNGGGDIFQGDNILELYKSRTMIEKTLLSEVIYNGKRQLLIDCYVDFKNLKENDWSKRPELRTLKFTPDNQHTTENPSRLRDSILGVIVDDINKNYLNVVKPDKKLSIIKAEVKATNELFAKAFNEQIVKNVNDFYAQTKIKKSQYNVSILQQKTDSVRRVMNGDIYAASIVSDATPNLNPTHQTQRIAPMQRSQFSAETNKAVLSELVKNLEISKLALLKETPLIQIVDEPKFPLERNKLSKITAALIGGVIAGMLASIICLIRLFLRSI